METCVFCDIVAGKAPASIVYKGAVVCDFLSIDPVNPGHVLVISKQHLPFLADLSEETGSHLFTVTMQMAKALRHSGVHCGGINLFLADGKAAFQEVFHIHMHVFHRFEGDPFEIQANWQVKPARQELDEIAARRMRVHELLRQQIDSNY